MIAQSHWLDPDSSSVLSNNSHACGPAPSSCGLRLRGLHVDSFSHLGDNTRSNAERALSSVSRLCPRIEESPVC